MKFHYQFTSKLNFVFSFFICLGCSCSVSHSSSAGQPPSEPTKTGNGRHIVILIDTSSSMLEAVGKKGGPAKGEKSRIDAIKGPLSDMIDVIKFDPENTGNNTSLHLYEFSKGAGDKGGTELGNILNGFKRVNLCRQLDITINEQKDRDEAKKWVDDLKLQPKGKIRPTWLYTSIDQVLTDTEKMQKADPKKPISFMVISDGADSENGKFKNMATVLEKHGKTFNKLENKYFIELVGFNNEGKKAWVDGGGMVQQPNEMKELAKVARQMAIQPVMQKKIFVKFGAPAEKIFAVKEEGVLVNFTNDSYATIGDKPIPNEELKYKWTCEIKFRDKWVEDWQDLARIPKPRLFTEGDYKVSLTVSHDSLAVPLEKQFTVTELKKPEIAATLKTKDPTAGKEVEISFDKYPDGIGGIKGSSFIIKHGDGKMTRGNADTEEVKITYKEPKAYQITIFLTLPGGEAIEIPGPAIVVKNPTGQIFVSKDNPWLGEKITFKSLTPIPDGVKAKYTWNLGGDVVREGQVIENFVFKKPGKKKVKLTIQRSDLAAKVIAMEEVEVKKIEVQIGVGQ